MTAQQKHIANAQQSYTLASRTGHRTDQSLPKSMPAPKQEKIQNIFSYPSEKLKYPTLKPTRQRPLNSTMTMVYRHSGQERQLVTAVWRHAG